jgi:diadenosine tetraphosphate (Ap4A) HIT family hydrolase
MEGCSLCADLQRGADHPRFIASFDETVLYLSADQCCAGWVTLVHKQHSEQMDLIDPFRTRRMLRELMRVGVLLRRALMPARLNFACLGNVVAHTHWHVIPRGGAGDPDPSKAVWEFPAEVRRGTLTESERARMAAHIRSALALEDHSPGPKA